MGMSEIVKGRGAFIDVAKLRRMARDIDGDNADRERELRVALQDALVLASLYRTGEAEPPQPPTEGAQGGTPRADAWRTFEAIRRDLSWDAEMQAFRAGAWNRLVPTQHIEAAYEAWRGATEQAIRTNNPAPGDLDGFARAVAARLAPEPRTVNPTESAPPHLTPPEADRIKCALADAYRQGHIDRAEVAALTAAVARVTAP